MKRGLDIVMLGLSITSSWGNGHATTYRGLVRGLCLQGHRVLFLERDAPWYASNRDLPSPPHGVTCLYRSLDELRARFEDRVREADLVMVGSFVPEGVAVGDWVLDRARGLTAFYDIDTPVTLAALEKGGAEYLSPRQIRRYGLYLSFTGGPTLERLEKEFGSPAARPLYCSFDPLVHYPEALPWKWDLGYLGTYSPDRMPGLEALLVEPARRSPQLRAAVAGPQYPAGYSWPGNVERIEHLAPSRHRSFYNRQAFAVNVTRADMARAGFSPSVRLFEAAGCATPVISDPWEGLERFFEPGSEILVASTPEESLDLLRRFPEEERLRLGRNALRRALAEHTCADRAKYLEKCVRELAGDRGGMAMAAASASSTETPAG
jgi:spore maturation protein CgeB